MYICIFTIFYGSRSANKSILSYLILYEGQPSVGRPVVSDNRTTSNLYHWLYTVILQKIIPAIRRSQWRSSLIEFNTVSAEKVCWPGEVVCCIRCNWP
jgi:hypothetical protein